MGAGEMGLGNGETREPGTESQQLPAKQNGEQRRGGTGNAEQESSWEMELVKGERPLVHGETHEFEARNQRLELTNRKSRRNGKDQGETRKP